jgi:hypothetical protein
VVAKGKKEKKRKEKKRKERKKPQAQREIPPYYARGSLKTSSDKWQVLGSLQLHELNRSPYIIDDAIPPTMWTWTYEAN